MKLFTSMSGIALFAAMLAFNSGAHASVAYNITGWDDSGTGGVDGGFPANWIGAAGPNYSGSLNAMWFANLTGNATENVSSTDARNNGADSTFALAVGPRAWSSNASGTLGKGHGGDYGLIHLDNTSNLIITVAADSALGSTLKSGFSLFQGWDVGTTAVRVQDYQNNQNNPLGTQGLTFLNSASTNIAGGLASFTFTNLSAGNYSLFVGGNATAGVGTGGIYTVALAASPVPVPGAVWLFGSVLAGFVATKRKN